MHNGDTDELSGFALVPVGKGSVMGMDWTVVRTGVLSYTRRLTKLWRMGDSLPCSRQIRGSCSRFVVGGEEVGGMWDYHVRYVIEAVGMTMAARESPVTAACGADGKS